MDLRTLTRTSGASSLVLAVVAAWLTFTAPGASALEQDRIVIRQDDVIEVAFGPIVGNNPANEARDPATCADSVYCDVIPLTVEVPDSVGPDDEYFLQLLMSWDSPKLPGDPVLEPEGIAINDMDTFVYTDPPTAAEAEARGAQPDSPDDPYITSGATQAEPEQAFLFNPRGDYLITVVNYVGSNTGYTLKLTWVSEEFPTPFESLAPRFQQPAPPSPTTTRPRTPSSTAPPASIAPAPPPSVTDATLPPLDAEVDPDFGDDEFASIDFEDQLSTPSTLPLVAAASRAPAPPSGLALVLWLLALPLGLCAIGGALLSRRSRRMISL